MKKDFRLELFLYSFTLAGVLIILIEVFGGFPFVVLTPFVVILFAVALAYGDMTVEEAVSNYRAFFMKREVLTEK